MKIDISTQTLFKFYIHILNTIFHYIDDKSFANYPQNIPRYSKHYHYNYNCIQIQLNRQLRSTIGGSYKKMEDGRIKRTLYP